MMILLHRHLCLYIYRYQTTQVLRRDKKKTVYNSSVIMLYISRSSDECLIGCGWWYIYRERENSHRRENFIAALLVNEFIVNRIIIYQEVFIVIYTTHAHKHTHII